MQPATASRDPQGELDFAAALTARAADGRKAERTRARLQAAACRLLRDSAPTDLTVAAICAEASVAHGTFYLYFKDIRHLLGETLTQFVDFVLGVMRQAARGGNGERIRATTAAYVALFERNPGLMRCLVTRFDEFPEAVEAFRRLNREWTATVADARLRQLQRKGEAALPRAELLRRAYALGGMVDQYLIMWLFGGDATLAAVSQDREAVIDTLSLIWQRGIDA